MQDREGFMKQACEAIVVLVEIKKRPGMQGTIECPRCKSEVVWHKAGGKSHVRFACTASECTFSGME